jgi:hypothetical protein
MLAEYVTFVVEESYWCVNSPANQYRTIGKGNTHDYAISLGPSQGRTTPHTKLLPWVDFHRERGEPTIHIGDRTQYHR